MWVALTTVDVAFLVMLTLLASPTILLDSAGDFVASYVPAAITVVLALFNSEEQLREAFTFLKAHGQQIDTWVEVQQTIWTWGILRLTNWGLVVISLVGCLDVLCADDPAAAMAKPHVRILFALSALFAWLQFFGRVFAPVERFSVFVLMVGKMVTGDILLWFAIALPLTVGFTTATNAVSVNAASFDVGDGDAHTWYHSFEEFMMLALIGLDPVIRLPPNETIDSLDAVSGYVSQGRRLKSGSTKDLGDGAVGSSLPSDYAVEEMLGVFYFIFYTGFMLIVVLMLVNLLIAMMGNTYSNTIASARLEGRVKFARLVISLELKAFNTPLGWLPWGKKWRSEVVEKLGRLGEPCDGLYYIDFRSYSMPSGMTHRGAQGDIFHDSPEVLAQMEAVRSAQTEESRSGFSPPGRALTKSKSFSGSIDNIVDTREKVAWGGAGSIDVAKLQKSLESRLETVEETLEERLEAIEEVLRQILAQQAPAPSEAAPAAMQAPAVGGGCCTGRGALCGGGGAGAGGALFPLNAATAWEPRRDVAARAVRRGGVVQIA